MAMRTPPSVEAGARRPAAASVVVGKQQQQQARYSLRVCVNKTCRKQGSREVLKFAQDLSTPELDVESCGCLGKCGSGPNVLIMPMEVQVGHVATSIDMAEVIEKHCGIQVPTDLLIATEIRQAGEALAQRRDLKGAIHKYTEALGLGVPMTLHLLYSNRSNARRMVGDHQGALEDAQKAVQLAPQGYKTAYFCLIDAYYIQGMFEQAVMALEQMVESNPEYKKTKEYKKISRQLEKDLATV